MKVEITARTGKGKNSSYKDVYKTFREVLKIAHKLSGTIVYGKGFTDGTTIVVES